MKRGDLLIAVLSGDYGKPRPVLLVQSAHLFDTESLLVCPLTSETSTASRFRLVVDPAPSNGLAQTSVVMTEKITAVPRRRCRERIGEITAQELEAVDAALMFVLGLTA